VEKFTRWGGGEALWLSGKVVKNEKIKGPGFAPHPGQPLKKVYEMGLISNAFGNNCFCVKFV
jgi:hypothetical protein